MRWVIEGRSVIVSFGRTLQYLRIAKISQHLATVPKGDPMAKLARDWRRRADADCMAGNVLAATTDGRLCETRT